MSVNLGHRDLQQLGDLADGEEFGLLRHTCHGGSFGDIRDEEINSEQACLGKPGQDSVVVTFLAELRFQCGRLLFIRFLTVVP